ncbi:MAG TPA: response regulator transcription factor [Actinomycetota bacterium]|nr:response regulator transcription factor [Actinomycetota bacterium]
MEEDARKIRILLADSQLLFREALRRGMEAEDDLDMVAEAGNGLQTLTEARRTRPDVLFLSTSVWDHDGVGLVAKLKSRLPQCRVVILADKDDQGVLVDVIEEGVSGYLTKESPLRDLVTAARAAFRGETVIPSRMVGDLLARLLGRQRQQLEAFRRMARLTSREREVLGLLTQGADKNAIARALVISPQTARTHIQNILTKLGLHSRLEAVAFVVRNQLMDDLVEEAS